MRPVALVTGAARGIGRACAVRLARSGFDVALVDRENAHSLAEVSREIETLGGSACEWMADVADLATHAGTIEAAVKRWGRLDCLVNNAALMAEGRMPFTVGQAVAVDGGLTTPRF